MRLTTMALVFPGRDSWQPSCALAISTQNAATCLASYKGCYDFTKNKAPNGRRHCHCSWITCETCPETAIHPTHHSGLTLHISPTIDFGSQFGSLV